jgi:hypothetical protein
MRLIRSVRVAYILSLIGFVGWLMALCGVLGTLVLYELGYSLLLTPFVGLPFVMVYLTFTKREVRLERFRKTLQTTAPLSSY